LARKSTKKKASKRKKRSRYTPEKKKELLKKYHALCKSGKTTAEAAKEIGVPYITLRTWERKTGKKRGRAGTKAKSASVSQKSGKLILETPKGYRIEGLSPSDLVKILKEVR